MNKAINPNITKSEYPPTYPAIFTQDSPAILPNEINTVFQIRLPIVVSVKNGTIDIFAIPAGIETRLLTIGINLPKNTADFPLLSNHSKALWISSLFNPSILPALVPSKLIYPFLI